MSFEVESQYYTITFSILMSGDNTIGKHRVEADRTGGLERFKGETQEYWLSAI